MFTIRAEEITNNKTNIMLPEAALEFFKAVNGQSPLACQLVPQWPDETPAMLIYFGEYADIVAFAN